MPNKTAYEPVSIRKYAKVTFCTKEVFSNAIIGKEDIIRKLDENNKGVEYAEAQEKLRKILLAAKDIQNYFFKSDCETPTSTIYMYIEYENSNDVEELSTLCKRFPDYLMNWSVEFIVNEGIYVPYRTSIGYHEDLDSIKRKILSFSIDKKTSHFYSEAIPSNLENISLIGAHKVDDYLYLTFSASEAHYIEELERKIRCN